MNRHAEFAALTHWLELGWLSRLDLAFAGFVRQQEPAADSALLWAAALVSRQLGRGEVYLDLSGLCSQPGWTLALPGDRAAPLSNETVAEALALLPDLTLTAWQSALKLSATVGSGPGATPLVLDGDRLYLRRYWQYQQILHAQLALRLQPVRTALPAGLQTALATLFEDGAEAPDWQKIACVLALRARIAIITGGPGTGKTTTLTKLLGLLLELAGQAEKPQRLNILLAAPTGKAAARVSASIIQAVERLPLADVVKQQIPRKAGTLHRLLGSRPDSRSFRHHRHNPLPADIVIVDEASMIDLEMMAALLEALPDKAQLILLGDKDQLASVEAGAVLGELCSGADATAYDADSRQWLANYAGTHLPPPSQTGTPINQQTVMLRTSHRFGEHSGIGRLARAVNAGDAQAVQTLLEAGSAYPDLNRIGLADAADKRLRQLVLAEDGEAPGYGHYLKVLHGQRPNDAAGFTAWAEQVLAAFDRFQLLCALRHGDWGVEGLNRRIEGWLFPQRSSLWYEGRPVMIARNDYNLGLMNGDIGITLLAADGRLRVVFPDEEGKIRWLSPMRLPELNTAFAMTVHKSQGSEFDHVALVLPDAPNPVLTRELLYTGITRAKARFTLLESRPGSFSDLVRTRTRPAPAG